MLGCSTATLGRASASCLHIVSNLSSYSAPSNVGMPLGATQESRWGPAAGLAHGRIREPAACSRFAGAFSTAIINGCSAYACCAPCLLQIMGRLVVVMVSDSNLQTIVALCRKDPITGGGWGRGMGARWLVGGRRPPRV